ncbi:Uncharacterized protein TCM_046309 [Theobroma cacao]|uniref:Uncharacterized protein n=1 Tax=Theobroma cacao TaxID=3641 RepID=S1RWB3_THECC|nr:Uncharacterized protein TCM_046309 [Theobroma cacao]
MLRFWGVDFSWRRVAGVFDIDSLERCFLCFWSCGTRWARKADERKLGLLMILLGTEAGILSEVAHSFSVDRACSLAAVNPKAGCSSFCFVQGQSSFLSLLSVP